MRKSFYLASAAIVATMLFSCAKVEEKSLSSEKGTLKVELTASTDTPATKVTIGSKDGTKYPVTWDAEGESVTMIEVRHGEKVNESSISSEEEYTLSQDKKTAKFSFKLEEANADSYDYLFVYPASTGFNKTQDPMTLTLSLPLSQTSAQNSADPKAVFLFSSVMGKTSQQTSFSTNFEAISAIGKMTLKNLPIEAGEKIENVSITAEGKDLSGKSWYVYEDGTFNHASSGANDKVSVDVKSITTSSDFTFWFSCWPCSFAAGDKLTIVATTDKTTYTREITMTAKELKAGNVNTIAVDMSSAVKPTTNETFTLTSLDAIQESDVVVIAMKKGDKYYAMTNDKGTSAGPSAVLTDVTNNTVKNPSADLRWNISSSDAGYIIRPAGDATKNLYSTNSNNGVRVGTTEGTWVLEGDYLKFTKEFKDNKDNPIYRYLGVYSDDNGPKDWRAYSSTTGNIAGQEVCFFAYSDSRTPQNLSFPEASYTAELGGTFDAPSVSGVITTVKYSSSNKAVATVNESTGAVTLVAAGTTTITAKAEASATYKAGTASYTLTVNTPGKTYASLAELVAAGAPTGENVTVTLTNEEITGIYVTSGGYRNGIYFKVGNQEVELYFRDVPTEWEVGGKVSGKLTDCPWKTYNSTWELAPVQTWAWTELSYTAPSPTCATPVITFDGSGKATITCATEGATIKYAISNTEPASFTNTYSSPVQLTDGQTIWAKASATDMQDSKVASKKYTAGGSGETKTLIIDGSKLTSTATKAEADYTYDGFTITMSDGAKSQAIQKGAENNFCSNPAILIGKEEKYIYNKTPIPGKITKFEIYSNKGASAKVSVGVLFSKTAISEYAEGTNTYTETLSTVDKVYDCSSKIPDGAKYFWYQVTNDYNSQVQFRITYTE
ncbi:MAG: chitobiase/beta-hexosaminidase C-terminal domain-containing protein [Bacteroidales bacterium]|nr:chitobiase/beta-hexosaminidase C-terminal domain-containing protein [Bacteroidales bacterium]